MDRWRRGLATVGLWLVCGLTAHAVPPDHIDQALEKICQRGAAASAAEYCRSQLYLHIENAPLRARWALRQLECLCQQALQDKADESPVWEAIGQVEQSYRQQYADDPRLPWLAWQLARADLLRSQLALAKWLAAPAGESPREVALQAVRRVLTQLDQVERDIKERLPLSQPRLTSAASQAPSRQLQELQIDCTALRCEALLVRARCYPAQSADHLAALAEVDRTATEVLSQSAADGVARQELLVAQATAGLELGRRQAALDVLAKILQGSTPPTSAAAEAPVTGTQGPTQLPGSPLARVRAGSALIEALCHSGHLAQAQSYLQALRSEFDQPEVALSQLRVDIAAMQAAAPAARAELLKAIVAQAAELGQRYGNYWRNRGEALLVAAASGSSGQPTTGQPPTGQPPTGQPPTGSADTGPGAPRELIAIEVRQLLSGGQTAAAIARLTKAVSDAGQAQVWSEALPYALEAARLMQQEKQWLAAADLLQPLTSAHPSLPEAASGQLLAAWCVAQALQAKNPSPELKDRYEQLLQQQLRLWPDAEEALTAQEYLANWYSFEKRYADLAAMWSDRAAAVVGAERQQAALENWLDTVIAKLPATAVEPETLRLAKEIATGKFANCRRSATIAALAAAMLTLPLSQAEAEALTGLALPGQNLEQPPGDQALLAALMTLAATRRHDATDAYSSLGILDHAQLSNVVQLAWCRAMVETFDEIGAGQITNWQPVAAGVRLPARQSQLTPLLKMTEYRLRQLGARELATRTEALTSIGQLAGEHASDPLLQLSHAAALAQSVIGGNDPDGNGAAALRLVKRVAVGTKKDSPAYLRARWLEAQWSLARGDLAAARQIAQLTLARGPIQPVWWEARFKKLAEGP